MFVRVFCDKRSRSGRERTVSVTEDDDDISLRGQGEVEVDVEDGVDVDNSLPPLLALWLQLAPSLARFPIFPFHTNGQRQRHERDGGSSGRIQITLLCRHRRSPSVSCLLCLVSAPRSALVTGYDAWKASGSDSDEMKREERRGSVGRYVLGLVERSKRLGKVHEA